jgi:hypothetical protein
MNLIFVYYICFMRLASVSGNKWLFLSTSLLLMCFACKRVPEAKPAPEIEKPVSSPKRKSIQETPPIPDKKPIAPSQARAVLQVVKVFTELETTGNGPCSKAPCKAEVKIMQVIGYGSGFTQTLAEGQQVQAYFPMTVQAVDGRPGVTVGKKITAELQNSIGDTDRLVVFSYTLLD